MNKKLIYAVVRETVLNFAKGCLLVGVGAGAAYGAVILLVDHPAYGKFVVFGTLILLFAITKTWIDRGCK